MRWTIKFPQIGCTIDKALLPEISLGSKNA